MSDRFERCKDHQVRNCLVCHPITRGVTKPVQPQVKAVSPQTNSTLPELPTFPSGSETEACPKCGGTETKPEGDHPAGNWWSVCAGCGLAVSKWDKYTQAVEITKPKELPHAEGLSYAEHVKINDRPVYTATSYEGQVTAASTRFTEACKSLMMAQTKVARLREELEAAKTEEEKSHNERVVSQSALQELIAKGAQ